MATSGVERQVRELLDATRRDAERYASAHYRGPHQEGVTGLGLRLEAIERALIELAQAIDKSEE